MRIGEEMRKGEKSVGEERSGQRRRGAKEGRGGEVREKVVSSG